MEFKHYLSRGHVKLILEEGIKDLHPIVQVLDYGITRNGRVRLHIYDGYTNYSKFYLSNAMFRELFGTTSEPFNTIMRIEAYTTRKGLNDINVVNVTNATILKPGNLQKEKLKEGEGFTITQSPTIIQLQTIEETQSNLSSNQDNNEAAQKTTGIKKMKTTDQLPSSLSSQSQTAIPNPGILPPTKLISTQPSTMVQLETIENTQSNMSGNKRNEETALKMAESKKMKTVDHIQSLSPSTSSALSTIASNPLSPMMQEELAFLQPKQFTPKPHLPPKINKSELSIYDEDIYPELNNLSNMDTCKYLLIFHDWPNKIYITQHNDGVVKMHVQKIPEPELVSVHTLDNLRNKRLIAGGGYKSFYLITADHELYVFGTTRSSVLVFGNDTEQYTSPVCILSNIVGAYFSIFWGVAIDTDGVLHVSGKRLHCFEDNPEFKAQPQMGPIEAVFGDPCENYPNPLILLTKKGRLLCWRGRDYQPTNVPMPLSKPVVQCALVYSAILVLFENGKLFLLTEYETYHPKMQEIYLPHGNKSGFTNFIVHHHRKVATVIAITNLNHRWVIRLRVKSKYFTHKGNFEMLSFKSKCSTECDALYLHQSIHFDLHFNTDTVTETLFDCVLSPSMPHLIRINPLIGLFQNTSGKPLLGNLSRFQSNVIERNRAKLIDNNITSLEILDQFYSDSLKEFEFCTRVSQSLTHFLKNKSPYSSYYLKRLCKYANWSREKDDPAILERMCSLQELVLRFLRRYYIPFSS